MLNNSKPLITTIIPTYKRPHLIGKAIESVLNQSFSDFLIYVCDNASGDETSEVVADYARKDARIKYFCHPENIQAIPNFNFGMRQVGTPFFSLLADDNALLSHFFEDAISILTDRPEAILFAGQTIMINEKGQRIGSSLTSWDTGLALPPEGLVNIWEKKLPTWESVLFRREVIESVGFLDISVNPSTDQDFMMKIARKHAMYISKKPCALFLRHQKAWAFNRDLTEIVDSWRKMAETWLHDEGLSESLKERIRKAYRKRARIAIVNNLYIEGIMKNNSDIVPEAVKILNEHFGFSFKTFRAVMIVKLAQQYKILRTLILKSSQWYIQTKRNLSNYLIRLSTKNK
ncbi:MAG: glycosyltransferase family A protein [Bacteroidetes bacterium]|nr:glycosyltransferase family A protein [Bacteroidota bacterium]